MSSQAAVHSIDELKNFRVALALYGEDTLGNLGRGRGGSAPDAAVARGGATGLLAGPDQAAAGAGGTGPGRCFPRAIFRRRPDYNPAMSEQKEALRKAEASLQDAEKRLVMVRKWQPMLRHAVLEYHASVQRLKDLAAGDVPSAVNLLTRIDRRARGLSSGCAAVGSGGEW